MIVSEEQKELDRWRGLGEAIRQIMGEPEGWPAHGNMPLAIAAAMQLAQIEVSRVTTPRPLSEWTEEDGDVLWWRFPIEEPPYCGSPLDIGRTIRVVIDGTSDGPSGDTYQVGGWPGYHTHWTRIPQVREP